MYYALCEDLFVRVFGQRTIGQWTIGQWTIGQWTIGYVNSQKI